jgi:hypothetical protein
MLHDFGFVSDFEIGLCAISCFKENDVALIIKSNTESREQGAVVCVWGRVSTFDKRQKKCQMLTGCPRTPGEHEVHPYLRPETLCRGSVRILYSPLYRISMIFAILEHPVVTRPRLA